MASLDLGPFVARAALARLAADPALRVLVGGRVRDAVPAREDGPFLRLDPVEASPYEASGWRGCACRLTVHAFVRGARSADPIQRLAAAVTAALDEADLALERGTLLWIAHERSLMLPEPQGPGSWHAVVRFTAAAAEEA
ncbi:hypothetical protein OPKNFCMD_5168 [Methylobacterium crusticola]|uniref:DUF3168 domain-containing protein n=1 Tax=Methylobacterium crusticola TaxID=1697972 RepID=A0ABQ4R3X9_9HYPH|nr:DUF3168 domain-containing protein [Methylobacterium crusticola]GJD52403.1 hypothetical protein OPKNFCMD_5168 [Methylobacterium crusticola]